MLDSLRPLGGQWCRCQQQTMWPCRAVNPSRPQQVNSDTYCFTDICEHHPGSSEPLGKKSPELSALQEMEVTGSHGELVYKFEGPRAVLTMASSAQACWVVLTEWVLGTHV